MSQMKQSEIRDYRLRQLRRQRYICPLCKERCEPEESALDHCHSTGHVRKVLHRSCNAAEGKILHWAKQRSRGNDPVAFLTNLLKYWAKDYTSNPIHPTHGRPVKRKRRRKQ